jgi:hypothetical protein
MQHLKSRYPTGDVSMFFIFIDISSGYVDGADMYRKRNFLIRSQAICSKIGGFLSLPDHIEDVLDMARGYGQGLFPASKRMAYFGCCLASKCRCKPWTRFCASSACSSLIVDVMPNSPACVTRSPA